MVSRRAKLLRDAEFFKISRPRRGGAAGIGLCSLMTFLDLQGISVEKTRERVGAIFPHGLKADDLMNCASKF
jgi:hypothetical protein